MAIFKISRPSDCGTYFQAYLQSVMIVANDRQEAESVLETWLKDNGESFIESKYPPSWETWAEEVTALTPQVIEWTIESDY